ncbi:DUF4412 domain-containing protein [Thioalkalivibrio sulfidiphilus]|uniref:DUF4412 domain-containing protein n=1 Tax=Thioalkalivibrio sulfidiphilus TaxID=1033854 RepID=UPI003B2BA7AB
MRPRSRLAAPALSLALGLAVASTSTALLADMTLHFTDSDGATGSRLMIKGELVRMEEQAEDGSVIYSLYDSRKRTLTMIIDEEQSYSELTEEGLKAQAGEMRAVQQEFVQQMREQMAQMPPEMRQQMEQQLIQMGFDPAVMAGSEAPIRDSSSLTTRKTGETSTINGVRCDHMEVLLEGRVTNQICVASPDRIRMNRADFATLKNLFEFMQNLSDIALSMGGPAAAEIGAEMLPVVDGIPVQVRNMADGSTVTLVSSSGERLSADLFRIPEGYQSVAPF